MVTSGARPVTVLVGPPGAGKSTVGRELAELLGADFIDTDERVEASTGRTISDIFVEDGEPAFRALERDAVRHAVTTSSGVVALGGGAVMDESTRELLAGHAVVFLDVTISDAARRVGFDRSRPLLAMNPRARWTALMNERRPVYESVSTVRLETGGRTPREIAEQIVAALREAGTA